MELVAARLALDEALTDQTLEPDDAFGVLLEGRERLVVDAQRDRRLDSSSVTSISLTTPTGAPAIFTSSSGHERGGVVEDRPARSSASVVSLSRASRTIPITIQGQDRHQQRRCRRASSRAGRGVGGIAAAGRERAPTRRAGAAPHRAGSASGSRARSPSSRWWAALPRACAAVLARRAEHRHHARVVAVRVVVAGHLAELREPARRGRACSRRAYSTTGWERSSARIARGKPSAVELREPGLLGGQLDQVVVGPGLTDQSYAGRRSSAARRPRAVAAGARTAQRRVAGFDSSTSSSRSSSVPRRLTKVVLALRKRVRQQLGASLQRQLVPAIARMAAFVFTTSRRRSSRRSASADTVSAPSATKRSSTA